MAVMIRVNHYHMAWGGRGLTRGYLYSHLEQAGRDVQLNPNYHGPLKLLNGHGLDGKSWFKKQSPFETLGRDSQHFLTVL